ncbi:hypothetical protein DFR70_105189 [Nocardia tenerifensis]|uniref:Uncharacterized protein n=1 Tax=Nocardia tenerifensis TaxID=228006 RepID=A0A318K0T1_9NOCA|nr:hypothetical protein [Nocardia tenerifensis]PXX64007.1 hypothetical protein DFR70_105189 [Nocardia tenerifensis]
MDTWDCDAIDLCGPGCIEFCANGTGEFAIIAVNGGMDCRPEQHGGRDGVGFSWEGHDEGDLASGRGWAVVTDERVLCGYLYFHLGDESGFRAVPFGSAAPEEQH